MVHDPDVDRATGRQRQRPAERGLTVRATADGCARGMRRSLVLACLAAVLVAGGSAAAQEGSGPASVFELLAASETDPDALRAAAEALTPARI